MQKPVQSKLLNIISLNKKRALLDILNQIVFDARLPYKLGSYPDIYL